MTKGNPSECMVRPVAEQPTSHNKKVAAFAPFGRSREHGSRGDEESSTIVGASRVGNF